MNKPICYSIGCYYSKGMLSDNPHSGVYEAATSRTLDLNGGNPACNQGGIMVLEPVIHDTHTNDVLRISEDGTVPTLQHRMGTGGNQVPLVFESHPMDCRVKELDTVGPTVTRKYAKGTADTPLVVEERKEQIDMQESVWCASTGEYMSIQENKSSTLLERDYKDPQIVTEHENETEYIVRRLTPIECARLQGFPDWWGELTEIEDMSDEDFEFWKEVLKTHAKINGKAYREKTKAQMVAWYNKLHTDSSEYKMWGNGVALPCVRVPIHGMAQRGAKTLGSLFDGSGGFPLAAHLDGIETLWASEIEPYCIAVTKERFKANEEAK